LYQEQILYWVENLIIGFYFILKIATASAPSFGQHLSKLYIVPFLSVRYGGFCTVHGVFLLAFLAALEKNGAKTLNAGDVFQGLNVAFGPFVFLLLLHNVIKVAWRIYWDQIAISVLCLFISRGFSFVQNHLLRRESQGKNLRDFLLPPYGRIIATHLGLFVFVACLAAFGSPLPFLAGLVILKTIVEVRLYRGSSQKA